MDGTIAADVQHIHLKAYPSHKAILEPFLKEGFSVTWAIRDSLNNTYLSFFFLRPSDELRATFGFEYEVLLAYSHYDSLEPRTLQAIDLFMQDLPARGRVESQMFLLVSEASDADEWVRKYLLEHRETRLAVPISRKYLKSSKSNWLVQDRIRESYFIVDRFKDSLPIKNDAFFFGRGEELRKMLDCVSRCENSGIFGLRKTGKTSLLFKMKRALDVNQSVSALMIDAELVPVRKRRWWQLLGFIAQQMDNDSNEDAFTELNSEINFKKAISSHLEKQEVSRLVIFFDEIDWIAPGTAKDIHWNDDFADFWQVLRAIQSIDRNICFVLAGVSPDSIEKSVFFGFQNPLFGIVSPIFLKGLTKSEVSDMVQKIGKLNGLQFAPDAVTYLFSEYSGHPLLTRLACSITHDYLRAEKKILPYRVTAELLRKQQDIRDRELEYYPQHIIFELQKFYSSEYSLLEALAIGEMYEFMKRSPLEGAEHLYRYGIVENAVAPYIPIKIVQHFIAKEEARRNSRSTIMRVVDVGSRSTYVSLTISTLVDDIRMLERAMRINNYPSLWGVNGFPEADKLRDLVPPHDSYTFGQALTVLQRCWVESIDAFGLSINRRNYFFELQEDYPDLYRALHRIRLYRNDSQHLFLNMNVEGKYQEYLLADLEDSVSLAERPWFLFQKTLVELQRSVHVELSRIESSNKNIQT